MLKNVEICIIIYTDMWKGYNGFIELGYHQFTVNRKTKFVNILTVLLQKKLKVNLVVKRLVKK